MPATVPPAPSNYKASATSKLLMVLVTCSVCSMVLYINTFLPIAFYITSGLYLHQYLGGLRFFDQCLIFFSISILYVNIKMLKVPNASPLLHNQNWFLFTFAFYLGRCSESWGGSMTVSRVFLRKVAMPHVDRKELLMCYC